MLATKFKFNKISNIVIIVIVVDIEIVSNIRIT